MKINIAENLKLSRKKKGLTQPALAEKIGVGKTTYIGWEQGINPPPADKLALIAEALNVPIDELLYGEKAGISGGMRDLLRRLEALPQEVQPIGIMMLRSLLFGLESVGNRQLTIEK